MNWQQNAIKCKERKEKGAKKNTRRVQKKCAYCNEKNVKCEYYLISYSVL